MAIHNEARKDQIAETVLMPGDPQRAKYIAEKYLEDYELVNQVRGILAYTGYYKGKRITVMASGMGMPSMGIYCYELFKFYDVQNIIRIGSCGAYVPELNLLDTILVDESYTEGNFAYAYSGEENHWVEANKDLNSIIEETAKESNTKVVKCNVVCGEVFDPYMDDPLSLAKRVPENRNLCAGEMESFALLYTAKKLNKRAACLLTVSDSNCKKEELTSEERQYAMNDMIVLALDTGLKL